MLLASWIDISPSSDFSIYNLPYGIFSVHSQKKVGVRIGDYVIDLSKIASDGFFQGINFDNSVFDKDSLNTYISLGKTFHQKIRQRILEIVSVNAEVEIREKVVTSLVPISDVKMHLPISIGDYTDFYSSEEHATNVGKMFRDPANALLPNWKHLPVAYHGRASSIVVSETDITRPWGQIKPSNSELPIFQPTQMLDFELEVAFVIGKNTELGNSITTHQADDYIFGLVLFNDWSARDIQSWEYVPLGPFLGKNFASSISPWVVPLEALDFCRTESPQQTPEVLPYLRFEGKKNYDMNLEVAITPKNGEEQIVCRSNFKYLYWNIAQQLAHHTINGCNVRVGDLCASGTISGKSKDSFGSMLELTWRGVEPIKMLDGTERKFINDYDKVTMRGFAEKDGIRVGFGEVSGIVLPAKI